MKTKSSQSKKPVNWEKVKTWLAPSAAVIAALASAITAIIAVYSIHHQAQLEQENRKQEHEKWESSFQAQIQLAETNRQRDFLVWERQQSEEWTQQVQTVQTQQRKLGLSEKEALYQDFVFHLQKTMRLIQTLAWSKWRLNCYVSAEIPIPMLRKSLASERQQAREAIDKETTRWENKVEKEQMELDEEELTVLRLVQAVKLKFSNVIQYPIDVGLDELSRVPIGITNSPETDKFIHDTFQNSTNAWNDAWYELNAYFNKMCVDTKEFKRLEKAWISVDDMMYREVILGREGLEIKPEYLTNSAPIVLTNGTLLVFERDDPEKLEFNSLGETNKLNR